MRFCAILLVSTPVASVLSAQAPPPALVETAAVEEREFHDQLTLVGRTEARAESRIVAEVAGRVRSVDAAEGRRVRRGDPLVTIDCRRIDLALEAKTAEAAQARADAELADKELARARDLVSTNVFPERNLDDAEAAAARTAERLRQLEAERRRLEIDLGDCNIVAPYDGFTVRKLVDVGEWVDPGTAVYEMVDLEVVRVNVDLPERSFGQLDLGSLATVTRAGDDEATLAGKVSGIAPRASETTHTFPVMISVPNPEGRLASGMLVRATLTLKKTFRSLAVSKDAVVREGERTFVYTVADGQAAQVPVRARARLGTWVAIEGDGLAAGQQVVVRGNERLFPGSPVRVAGGGGTPGKEDGP